MALELSTEAGSRSVANANSAGIGAGLGAGLGASPGPGPGTGRTRRRRGDRCRLHRARTQDEDRVTARIPPIPQCIERLTGSAVYTGSNSCQTLGDGSVRMGLSVGWGDKYPYYLVDQYIDIGGLPAGEYTVTATADWDHWFTESNTTNNSTTARIRLSKNGVTVLDPGTGP